MIYFVKCITAAMLTLLWCLLLDVCFGNKLGRKDKMISTSIFIVIVGILSCII